MRWVGEEWRGCVQASKSVPSSPLVPILCRAQVTSLRQSLGSLCRTLSGEKADRLSRSVQDWFLSIRSDPIRTEARHSSVRQKITGYLYRSSSRLIPRLRALAVKARLRRAAEARGPFRGLAAGESCEVSGSVVLPEPPPRRLARADRPRSQKRVPRIRNWPRIGSFEKQSQPRSSTPEPTLKGSTGGSRGHA